MKLTENGISMGAALPPRQRHLSTKCTKKGQSGAPPLSHGKATAYHRRDAEDAASGPEGRPARRENGTPLGRRSTAPRQDGKP